MRASNMAFFFFWITDRVTSTTRKLKMQSGDTKFKLGLQRMILFFDTTNIYEPKLNPRNPFCILSNSFL